MQDDSLCLHGMSVGPVAPVDRVGRLLPRWRDGVVFRDDKVFPASPWSPWSVDARSFGPDLLPGDAWHGEVPLDVGALRLLDVLLTFFACARTCGPTVDPARTRAIRCCRGRRMVVTTALPDLRADSGRLWWSRARAWDDGAAEGRTQIGRLPEAPWTRFDTKGEVMTFSTEHQLARLHAREATTRQKLDAQRRKLQGIQLRERQQQKKLTLERQRAMGALADAAGLGVVDLEVLRGAFQQLARDLGVGAEPGGTTPEASACPAGQNGARLTTVFPLRETGTPNGNHP